MAKLTRIKILTTGATTTAPSNLKTGELAYSYVAGSQSNNGDRLYIGTGAENGGVAPNVDIIGGKYFTNLLDHAHGTLTADSALIVDSDSKLDRLNVDNLRLDGNSLTSQDTNGNIVIDPNGTGKLVLHNVYINGTTDSLEEFIYDTVGGAVTGGTGITVTNDDAGNTSTVSITDITFTDGQAGTEYGSATAIPAITVNAQGQVTRLRTFNVATSLTVDGDTGTGDVDLLSDDLRIVGTTNEIETVSSKSGTDVTVQVGLPDDVTIGNDLTVSNDLAVTGDTTLTGNLSVNGSTINLGNGLTDNVVISGNLTVQGTTTTVESTTVTIDDPVIALADNTTSTTSDGLDRGVRFKWGDGSAVATGFFGFDIQTERFVFTKDETVSSDDFSSPWSDAEFGDVYATGADIGNIQIGITGDNEIDTVSGNLTIDSAGGTVTVDDNLSVSGTATVTGQVTLSDGTGLRVSEGGTGQRSFTGDAIFVSNAAGTAMNQLDSSATASGTHNGDLVMFSGTGVPFVTDIIDGGTY